MGKNEGQLNIENQQGFVNTGVTGVQSGISNISRSNAGQELSNIGKNIGRIAAAKDKADTLNKTNYYANRYKELQNKRWVNFQNPNHVEYHQSIPQFMENTWAWDSVMEEAGLTGKKFEDMTQKEKQIYTSVQAARNQYNDIDSLNALTATAEVKIMRDNEATLSRDNQTFADNKGYNNIEDLIKHSQDQHDLITQTTPNATSGQKLAQKTIVNNSSVFLTAYLEDKKTDELTDTLNAAMGWNYGGENSKAKENRGEKAKIFGNAAIKAAIAAGRKSSLDHWSAWYTAVGYKSGKSWEFYADRINKFYDNHPLLTFDIKAHVKKEKEKIVKNHQRLVDHLSSPLNKFSADTDPKRSLKQNISRVLQSHLMFAKGPNPAAQKLFMKLRDGEKVTMKDFEALPDNMKAVISTLFTKSIGLAKEGGAIVLSMTPLVRSFMAKSQFSKQEIEDILNREAFNAPKTQHYINNWEEYKDQIEKYYDVVKNEDGSIKGFRHKTLFNALASDPTYAPQLGNLFTQIWNVDPKEFAQEQKRMTKDQAMGKINRYFQDVNDGTRSPKEAETLLFKAATDGSISKEEHKVESEFLKDMVRGRHQMTGKSKEYADKRTDEIEKIIKERYRPNWGYLDNIVGRNEFNLVVMPAIAQQIMFNVRAKYSKEAYLKRGGKEPTETDEETIDRVVRGVKRRAKAGKYAKWSYKERRYIIHPMMTPIQQMRQSGRMLGQKNVDYKELMQRGDYDQKRIHNRGPQSVDPNKPKDFKIQKPPTKSKSFDYYYQKSIEILGAYKAGNYKRVAKLYDKFNESLSASMKERIV